MLRLRSCYLCLFTLLLSLCSVQGAQAGSAPYSEAGALNSLEAQREGTVDADGDGFSPYFSDCDDNDASIYPGAIDPLGDRIDQDCGGRDGPQPSVGLPNSAFDSIAEAIAAALPRETVWVGPGTYYEGDMVISTGNMIIAGTHGPAETTVDGLGFDSIFTVDASTSLRGLHLVNARHSIELVFSLAYMYLEELIVETGSGDKSNSIYVSMGGATLRRLTIRGVPETDLEDGALQVVFGEVSLFDALIEDCGNDDWGAVTATASVLTVKNSRFENNHADGVGLGGGGIDSWESTVDITGSLFRGNSTRGKGGAINNHKSTEFKGGRLYIDHSQFEDNTSEEDGGALFMSADSIIRDTVFRGNQAGVGTDPADGGALYYHGATAKVERSLFEGNEAGGGGGAVGGIGSGVHLRNSLFMNNKALGNGGAIQMFDGRIEVESSSLSGNRAEGTGGGIYLDEASSQRPSKIYNSILAYNHPDNAIVGDDISIMSASYSALYMPSGWSNHNIYAGAATNLFLDPEFIEMDGETPKDLHLSLQSPLVGMGAVDPFSLDGSRLDIGAYGGRSRFNLDGDAFPQYNWPGTLNDAPEGVDADDWESFEADLPSD